MQPGKDFEHRPGRIEFAPMHAELCGSRICVVIIVPAFTRGQKRDEAEVRSCVVKVTFAEGMIGAVDDSIQENVQTGLRDKRDPSPERSKDEHEECDSHNDSGETKSENVAIKPVIADIWCERLKRLGILCLTVVVVDVAKKNAPQAFENGAVRISFHIGVPMVLAMHRDPFLCVDAGPQPKLHAHRKGNYGIEIHAAMSQCSMEVNAGGECGKLNDHNYSNDCV